MPITQDRLIKLINIADEALMWADDAKNLAIGNLETLLGQVDTLMFDESYENAAKAVELLTNHLLVLQHKFLQNPIPIPSYVALAEERAHFKLAKKRNDGQRLLMQIRRGQMQDPLVAPTLVRRPRKTDEQKRQDYEDAMARWNEDKDKPNDLTKPEKPQAIEAPDLDAELETQPEPKPISALEPIHPTEGDDMNFSRPVFGRRPVEEGK